MHTQLVAMLEEKDNVIRHGASKAQELDEKMASVEVNAGRVAEVRFQWKNPDFLSRNPDFLLKKNVKFIIKPSWRPS